MNPLAGKVVLIVGGGTGIGLAMGVAFAQEGCRVILAGRREAVLREAAKKYSGSNFSVRVCDASERAQVGALVEWSEQTVGSVEILCYCAGVNVPKRLFSNVAPDEFDRVMAVNATGAFNCIHAVLPGMRERRSGTIFNVVSVSGVRTSLLGGMPYSAAKFAQHSLGTSANLEAMADGVRVTNIHPGETNTPILDLRPSPPPEERRETMLQPEDVAAMAVAVARLPARVVVPEIVLVPGYSPFA